MPLHTPTLPDVKHWTEFLWFSNYLWGTVMHEVGVPDPHNLSWGYGGGQGSEIGGDSKGQHCRA